MCMLFLHMCCLENTEAGKTGMSGGDSSGKRSSHQKKNSQKEAAFERQVGGKISEVGVDSEDDVDA